MLKTALLSGIGITDYRYQMVPTPVDYVAQALVALSTKFPNGGGIFHISGTNQEVDDVFEYAAEVAGRPLELVRHFDWIQGVKRLYEAGHSLPAVPLIEFAFAMDEVSFNARLSREYAASVQFDCSYTHEELERAGIITPTFSAELLALAVEDMLARDPDLRDLIRAPICKTMTMPTFMSDIV